MGIASLALPFLESQPLEFDARIRLSCIEVKVIIDFIFAIVPTASQQFARIEINNILFKRERGMLLLSASHQLTLATQGENIIPDDVLLPVMLMKSGALGS